MARFRNLDGSGPNAGSQVFRWAVIDKVTGRRRRSARAAPVPWTKTDPGRIAVAPRPGEPARLTWIGHASWLVQLDGVSLLIDPVFSRRISGIVPRNVPAPLQPTELPRIDATLVTHSHYDHYDRPSVNAAGARVITGSGLGREMDLPSHELGWWDTERVGDGVRVSFVPSQHWSRRGLFDTNETLWGGFVIEGSRARVYHAGDTAWFAGFKEIGERFPDLDAALLPIGAYDPGWFMEKQHMNPEQAVQAFLDLRARRLVAMHWGTFKLTDEPLNEPPQRLRAEWLRRGLPEDGLRIPAIGATLEL
jgi:L-ascorbate metabolism protein UlaG (beta-lactamase superfamily)